MFFCVNLFVKLSKCSEPFSFAKEGLFASQESLLSRGTTYALEMPVLFDCGPQHVRPTGCLRYLCVKLGPFFILFAADVANSPHAQISIVKELRSFMESVSQKAKHSFVMLDPVNRKVMENCVRLH
jgi:hypothetical protein